MSRRIVTFWCVVTILVSIFAVCIYCPTVLPLLTALLLAIGLVEFTHAIWRLFDWMQQP